MTGVSFRVAVIATASLLWAGDTLALSFDERWQSLYAESEVSGDAISAKAEMLPRAERSKQTERSQPHRRHASSHRSGNHRVERRREWYKGGKKWHYVEARRKRGRR